jgi:Restriction endonuclease
MVVVVAALAFGLLVIAVIARYARNVPRADPRAHSAAPDVRPPITPREFESVVRGLIGALGLDVVSVSAGAGGVLDMVCRDPRPLSGGRLLVHASPITAGGQIDAAAVLAFAESVRGDMGTLKGIDIEVAGFTDEAYAAARATPAQIELVDAPGLVELVREHLPHQLSHLERFRSFSAEGRRRDRSKGGSGDDNAGAPLAS